VASVGQIVAPFQADDVCVRCYNPELTFQALAQSAFANGTLDFIALWIWSKMRSSAFCSIAPHTQVWQEIVSDGRDGQENESMFQVFQ
jgi:hypothetical protein